MLGLVKGIFDVAGTVLGYGLKAGVKLGIGTAQGVYQAGVTIGKPLAKGAGAVAEVAGNATKDFFHGAGDQVATAFSTKESAMAVGKTWGSLLGGVGRAFVKTDAEGKLSMTGFGMLALGGAMTLDKSRDIYTEEKARRMGEVDNKPVSLTPQMTIPQYEFNPRKRMGALDGGASGSLVFALHNMR